MSISWTSTRSVFFVLFNVKRVLIIVSLIKKSIPLSFVFCFSFMEDFGFPLATFRMVVFITAAPHNSNNRDHNINNNNINKKIFDPNCLKAVNFQGDTVQEKTQPLFFISLFFVCFQRKSLKKPTRAFFSNSTGSHAIIYFNLNNF